MCGGVSAVGNDRWSIRAGFLLRLGLAFASKNIFLDLLQLCFDLGRNERIELVEGCETDFTRLKCTDVRATCEGAVCNRLDRG
jgi:hypothetical protein